MGVGGEEGVITSGRETRPRRGPEMGAWVVSHEGGAEEGQRHPSAPQEGELSWGLPYSPPPVAWSPGNSSIIAARHHRGDQCLRDPAVHSLVDRVLQDKPCHPRGQCPRHPEPPVPAPRFLLGARSGSGPRPVRTKLRTTRGHSGDQAPGPARAPSTSPSHQLHAQTQIRGSY